MGINMEIIHKCIREWVNTRNMPWSKLTFMPLQTARKSKEVVYLDLSSRWYSVDPFMAHKRKGIRTSNIQDICSYLLGMVLKQSNGATAVVLMLDKKQFVPIEKKEEQDSRKKASASQGITPYPFDCQTIEQLPNPQEISVDRLCISNKHLIRDLVKEFINYAKQQQPFPLTVIVDCQFDGNPVHLVANTMECREEPSWYHEIGEAEMRIFWWSQVLRSSFSSIANELVPVIALDDSDVLPLSLNYLSYLEEQKQPLPPQILWIRDESDKEYKTVADPIRGIDLVQFYQAIRNGWLDPLDVLSIPQNRIKAFVMVCAVCSCDYYKHKLLTYGFGVKAMASAVIGTWRSIEADRVDPEVSSIVDDDAVARYVYTIYTQNIMKDGDIHRYRIHPHYWLLGRMGLALDKLNEDDTGVHFVEAMDWLAPKFGKKFKLPNHMAFVSGKTKLKFVDKYWRTEFTKGLGDNTYIVLNDNPPTETLTYQLYLEALEKNNNNNDNDNDSNNNNNNKRRQREEGDEQQQEINEQEVEKRARIEIPIMP